LFGRCKPGEVSTNTADEWQARHDDSRKSVTLPVFAPRR
jgi:hypothetical protein